MSSFFSTLSYLSCAVKMVLVRQSRQNQLQQFICYSSLRFSFDSLFNWPESQPFCLVCYTSGLFSDSPILYFNYYKQNKIYISYQKLPFIISNVSIICILHFITYMAEDNAEPVPTTKQQLIEMLKTQLEKVEDEITEIQTNLEQQRQKRKTLTEELEQKEEKIKELIENQSKTLGDKVHEGLYKTLQAANKMRADADAESRKLAEDNTIVNEKIVHKDNTVIEDKMKILLNTKKIGSLEQKKIDAQRKQQKLIDKKQEVSKQLEMMKQELERIEREQKQLRNHIENMKKLRLYLNKHLEGNLKTTNNQNPRGNKASVPDGFWAGN